MRSPSTQHHERFHEAVVGWMVGKEAGADAASEAARIAQRWLGEHAEDARTVQRLVLGAAFLGKTRRDPRAMARMSEVGLDASLVGALDAESILSAAILALFGAQAAVANARLNAARLLLDRAAAALPLLDQQDVQVVYAAMLQHAVAGELAEAALERAAAERHCRRALELGNALLQNRRLARQLLPAWTRLFFGDLPASMQEQVPGVLAADLRTTLHGLALRLGRVAPEVEAARLALRSCRENGLPLDQPVSVLHDAVCRLPAEEAQRGVADVLPPAAALDPATRSTWMAGLQAALVDAHLRHGDLDRALDALAAVDAASLMRCDAVARSLFFGAETRVHLAAGAPETARASLFDFLESYGAAVRGLSGTAHRLPFQAVCEPVFLDALESEAAAGSDADGHLRRRELALLLDALRAPDEIPAGDLFRDLLLDTSAADLPAAERSMALLAQAAHDRIGRLLHALAQRPDVLVIVAQHLRSGVLLLCLGGQEREPALRTVLGREAEAALAELTRAADLALGAEEPAGSLAARGRAAFAALPADVQQRIRTAGVVLFVPDFAAGQERVPIELLHDGQAFVGISKVLSRCISLRHAVQVLEAPVRTRRQGRRALCVAVAQPPGLPPLAGARQELERVQRALGGAGWDMAPLRESEATPEAVLELAPLADVLHVACHGDASPGAEALVLGDGRRLEPGELAGRHRLGAMVYLNACSLARTRYLGGGASRGMAYAFVAAGAPSVIASLLPLEDASAAGMAAALYSGPRGESIGDALRRARKQLGRSGVRPALWSMTVLLGSPFVGLDGQCTLEPDASVRLLQGQEGDRRARLLAARSERARSPGDVRLQAAMGWLEATGRPKGARWDVLAAIARELGHATGEAECLQRLAEECRGGADTPRLAAVLERAIAALAPLRGSSPAAWQAFQQLQQELRSLDPAYQPRTLRAVRLESGMTINDRSNPAVDAILRLQEALDENEQYWRGEPALRAPDEGVQDVAWNAVVWGHRHRLHGTGAEADYAAACADRLVGRGLVPDTVRGPLARILCGVLAFCWGQQRVTHLDFWMARAHADTVRLMIESVRDTWTPPGRSPALALVPELELAIAQATARAEGSKFARARASLAGAQTPATRIAALETVMSQAIAHCARSDPAAAGALAAWCTGAVCERIANVARDARSAPDLAPALDALRSRLDDALEGRLQHYLWEGFRPVREKGGMDPLDRWRQSVV